MTTKYDYIIVGAGSSGAVLAARLSEDPERSILLLEAGPDYADIEKTPDDLLNAYWPSTVDHDWGFKAEAVPGRDIDYTRAKVSGGGSAVNGAIAIRGVPEDYDEWTELGNDDWSWEKCLPYFRKLEDDQDESGDFHGKGGPIPVVRWKEEELRPLQKAFRTACVAAGAPLHDDFNAPGATGFSPMAQNREGRTRISTAIGYLQAVRNRLNLTIRPHCLVRKILFEDGRAVGLEVEAGGEVQRVEGDEIILSAGAVQSPAILLRSGIGPQADIGKLGISLEHESPGVGQNLIEHPMAGILCTPKEGVIDMEKPLVQGMLRYTADGGDENDMQMYMMNHVDLRDLPEMMENFGVEVAFGVFPGLQRPDSRGQICVDSMDPTEQPRIELNFFDTDTDKRRMREGMRMAWDVVNSAGVQEQAEAILLLDQETVDDDDALDQYVWDTAIQIFHPVGTAKMGPAEDGSAVVDQFGRVHGVAGLRVVDASIMPTTPRANTNLTCIMIGEHIAASIRDE